MDDINLDIFDDEYKDINAEVETTEETSETADIIEEETEEETSDDDLDIFGILGIPIQKKRKETTSKPKTPATVKKEEEKKEQRIILPVTVRYAFQNFTLTPDDFSGKTEVTLEDIRVKFVSRGYTELRADRTTMEIENGIVFPIVTAGRKG